jgi:hypothetical protein
VRVAPHAVDIGEHHDRKTRFHQLD